MALESLEERAQRLFGKSADEIIPQLLLEEKSVHKVAIRMEAYPNAIRFWMKKHGYSFNAIRVVELEKTESNAPSL